MVQHHPQVHQHSDGHEEQTVETVTERQDLRQSLDGYIQIQK